jgi:hypothetical protein
MVTCAISSAAATLSACLRPFQLVISGPPPTRMTSPRWSRAWAVHLGGYDLRSDELDHAAQAGGGGVRPFACVSPNLLFAKLALKQRELAAA